MNDGGPAFPASLGNYGEKDGMSLRDWFAGQALIGLLSNVAGTHHHHTELAEFAYQTADAMLAERKKHAHKD